MTRERRGFLLFNILLNDQEGSVNDEAISMLMTQNDFSYFSKVQVTE